MFESGQLNFDSMITRRLTLDEVNEGLDASSSRSRRSTSSARSRRAHHFEVQALEEPFEL
jgi:hypothetical protein